MEQKIKTKKVGIDLLPDGPDRRLELLPDGPDRRLELLTDGPIDLLSFHNLIQRSTKSLYI
jgi:hypothetical protein